MVVMFNSPIKESYERALSQILSEANDLYIVCAEYKLTEKSHHTEFKGLEIAQEYASDPLKIVILMSFLSEEQLFSKRPDLYGLLSFKNIGFLQLPTSIPEIIAMYGVLKRGEKKEDELKRITFEIEMLDRTISILRHDLSYAQRDTERKEKWIKQAQSAGFSGTFDEMAAKVQEWKRSTAGRFEGKTLRGIFVDFQGTIVVNGKLNEKVLKIIKDLQSNRSLCIISDSNLGEVHSILEKLGISYPILSKFELKGATLETVIDDLPQERFRKEYEIIPQQYIQV